MGLEGLDLTFQLEREFKVRLATEPIPEPVPETAADVVKWVEAVLIKNKMKVPDDCWPRVRLCIATVMNIPLEDISLDSRLIEDLGF